MLPLLAALTGDSQRQQQQQQQPAGVQLIAQAGLAWPGFAGEVALPAVMAEAAGAPAAAAAPAQPQPQVAAGSAPPTVLAGPPRKKPGRQRRTSILCQVGQAAAVAARLCVCTAGQQGGTRAYRRPASHHVTDCGCHCAGVFVTKLAMLHVHYCRFPTAMQSL